MKNCQTADSDSDTDAENKPVYGVADKAKHGKNDVYQ